MRLLLFTTWLTLVASAPAIENELEAGSLNSGRCVKPSIRKEWRRMLPEDRTDYIRAEKCLMKKPARTVLTDAHTRFEDMQAVHQNWTTKTHLNSAFLPWHRYFLHIHELLLRTECDYKGPLPWWDETLDRGHFETAPLFTDEYFGTAEVVEDGVAEAPCVNDGPFGGLQLNIGPGPRERNAPHCLNRGVNNVNSHWMYQAYVDACNSYSDYEKMWNCTAIGPHAFGHIALTGTMSDVQASPGDPVFYLHHAFIDRNWRLWQKKDRKNRVENISGWAPNDELTEWIWMTLDYVLESSGLTRAVKTREVMDTMGGYLCYKYDY